MECDMEQKKGNRQTTETKKVQQGPKNQDTEQKTVG